MYPASVVTLRLCNAISTAHRDSRPAEKLKRILSLSP